MRVVGERAFSPACHQNVNSITIKALTEKTSLALSLSEVLVLTTRGAAPLFFVAEIDSLCVGSPHMVFETTFPEKCCAKPELAALELQE